MWHNTSDKRKSLNAIIARYNRLARFYRFLEPLYLIFPLVRRKAVAALRLQQGQVVLEIGAGTGRNIPYLVDAVGPSGTVIAVDASPGMLAEAHRLVDSRGWSNVELLHQDAAHLEVGHHLDAVLFSFSYSALPEPRSALARAWERMQPGSRVVVLAGNLDTRLNCLLGPIARLLIELAPGDPYSNPWDDLAAYGPIRTERFLLGIHYISVVIKPQRQ